MLILLLILLLIFGFGGYRLMPRNGYRDGGLTLILTIIVILLLLKIL